jgi:DNA-binding IclR family transcriptional regulator
LVLPQNGTGRGEKELARTVAAHAGANHHPSDADVPAYRLQSVDHVLLLLLLFRTKPSLRVAEVADHLGVARSTAHRLLGMLVYRQFAVQDAGTKEYLPGPRLVEIGLAAAGALNLRARMRPYLNEIAAITGETVSLLVLEGDSVHFEESIESQRTVRVSARPGQRVPAHATSGGKAILAALPLAEVLAIYPSERLVTATERTLGTRDELLAELARVRDAGFATNFEEREAGLGAVGMAVIGAGGRPAAAFAVAVPMQRMTEAYVGEIARALRAVVATASADLRDLRTS